VTDGANNPLEDIIAHFAAQVPGDAPGAGDLAELAAKGKHIPDQLLAELDALIEQLDVPLVGNDIACALIDVSRSEARYADAVHFAWALKMRLQGYVDDPRWASEARGSYAERVACWRAAL
jgi:hypothetical protein